MIIVHLAGGLGNQMFQYAFGLAATKRLGVALRLELSNRTLQIHNGFELDRIFNIQASEAAQSDMQTVLGFYRSSLIRKAITWFGLEKLFLLHYVEEPHFYYFAPEMLKIPDNSYVSGYWQSEKYFREINTTLRSDFAFKQPLSIQNAEVVENISLLNSVSLHVRRGDYANDPKVRSTHGLCTLEYYQAAIRYIAEKVKNPHFFVFSDDIEWTKKVLKTDFPCQYVDHNKGDESYNDMRLMSLCQHHIIANSSFSWWGAWLNPSTKKIVIAPTRWFENETDVRDLIPQGWVTL